MGDKKNKTRAEMARAHGMRFTGRPLGRHITGVPMKNIPPDAVGKLQMRQIDACLDSGLYVVDIQDDTEENNS